MLHPNRLRSAREAMRLADGGRRSMRRVARELGISMNALSRFERGIRQVPDAYKRKMAAYYGVPAAWLFYLDESVPESGPVLALASA